MNRTLGKVTFTVAPGASPVEGEDNVRITYAVESRAEVVNKLRFSILYGVNGAMDRVFMSGSPDEPNVDYWSEWNDPAYIGDVNYSQLGQSSAIVGYSVLNNYLVTHKSGEENGRNAFVRAGELDTDGNAVFKITNVVQGDGAASTRSFASLNSEPMFLTPRGVYALTPSDITGERYAQCRSFYVNGALQKLDSGALQAACAVTWGRFYVLAAGGKLYLLDGDQKTYESKSPYSAHQYECYVWNVEAACLWTREGALWFGCADGSVRCFARGLASVDYADDGAAIAASWQTPLMNLSTWANKKTVTGVWVACQPYPRSGAAVRSHQCADKRAGGRQRQGRSALHGGKKHRHLLIRRCGFRALYVQHAAAPGGDLHAAQGQKGEAVCREGGKRAQKRALRHAGHSGELQSGRKGEIDEFAGL